MNNLKKNIAYNVVYQILLIILPLITAPYVSRILGVVGIGTYSYIYSIAYYFGLFGMLGISNHGSRSVALNKNDKNQVSKVFSNLYIIQFVTSLISMTIYLIFVVFFFEGNKQIAMIDLLFVLSYVLDINWFFFGMEQFKITVTRNIIIKISTVVLTFLFVKSSSDLWLYTFILASGALINQLYLWLKIKKFVFFIKPDIKTIKSNIKPMFILFIPVIAYSIYKVMDKIMLGSMTTVMQVGLYENAEKIVSIPLGLITAFGTVMLPKISSLLSTNDLNQATFYNKISTKYFSILVFGCVFGLVGVSDILSTVYFGEDFRACAPLIKGLSFSLIFITWANIIRTQYLIPTKNDKPYVVSSIIGAGINLIFNFIFIPKLGAAGALIGTLLAEFSVFAVQLLCVKNQFPMIKYLKDSWMYMFMGITMCFIVRLIGNRMGENIVSLASQVFVGMLFYGLGCVLLLIIQRDQLVIGYVKKISNNIKVLSK